MLIKIRYRLLFLLIILAAASLACKAADIYSDMTFDLMESLFPELIYGNATQQDDDIQPENNPPEDLDSPSVDDRWDIYQCNAIQEVNIRLTEFEEFQDEDGMVECSYGHEITNLEGVRIIYHSYFHYGDLDPITHEDGWISKGFGPNLESYSLRSSLTNCPNCTPVRWESVLLTIAVVYDRPECAWITDGGVHFDILHITEEEPVICPCTLLFPEHIPDVTEGLIRD